MYIHMKFYAMITLAAASLSMGRSFHPMLSLPHRVATSVRFRQPTDDLASYKSVKSSYMNVRGGSIEGKASLNSATEFDGESKLHSSGRTGAAIASFWGAGGVIMILANSIKKITPIALEPFLSSSLPPLSNFQLLAYAITCIWFAYVEGYKGFQTKFSPLVVSRSLTLKPCHGSPIHHVIFAPFYSMGLFYATKKRKIVSWSVSLGVACIVAAVKRFPYPWRNIIDAGVVVGLTWGSFSIAIQWVQAYLSKEKSLVDPCLPSKEEGSA